MTTENRIYSVTLAFEPPGPLHTSLLIAPDEAMAAALAMQTAMEAVPEHSTLVGTTVFVVDADVLRLMLRAIDGKGPAEVVSLVPKEAVHGILRQAPPDATPVEDMPWAGPERPLDAADASTFCGSGATDAWERYRAEHLTIYGPPIPIIGRPDRLSRSEAFGISPSDAIDMPFGPPKPGGAA